MATPEELLDRFSYKIYEAPLADLRETGAIRNLANPVAVLILAIDFLTDVDMNGIYDFLGNSSGRFAGETVEALRLLGCNEQADLLARIISLADASGMTHEAIQRDRSTLPDFSVTSFSKTHGDKWDDALTAIDEVEARLDYNAIRVALEPYFHQHLTEFEFVLRDV